MNKDQVTESCREPMRFLPADTSCKRGVGRDFPTVEPLIELRPDPFLSAQIRLFEYLNFQSKNISVRPIIGLGLFILYRRMGNRESVDLPNQTSNHLNNSKSFGASPT